MLCIPAAGLLMLTIASLLCTACSLSTSGADWDLSAEMLCCLLVSP